MKVLGRIIVIVILVIIGLAILGSVVGEKDDVGRKSKAIDESASTPAAGTVIVPIEKSEAIDQSVSIPRSALPDDLAVSYVVAKATDISSFGIWSRHTVEIEAPDAQTDRVKIATMMVVAVEHYHQHRPDVVSVRLWHSYGSGQPAQKVLHYAPDGCGWVRDKCTGMVWTNGFKAPIPAEWAEWGKP